MRFDELPRMAAIYRVRRDIEECGDLYTVGSDEWVRGAGALELTRRIKAALVKVADSQLIKSWLRYRKDNRAIEGQTEKKADLIVRLYEVYGPSCFYSLRGLGECSNDVTLDRIVAGGEYTFRNCVLACGRHNSMRGCAAIQDFLKRAWDSEKAASDGF